MTPPPGRLDGVLAAGGARTPTTPAVGWSPSTRTRTPTSVSRSACRCRRRRPSPCIRAQWSSASAGMAAADLLADYGRSTPPGAAAAVGDPGRRGRSRLHLQRPRHRAQRARRAVTDVDVALFDMEARDDPTGYHFARILVLGDDEKASKESAYAYDGRHRHHRARRRVQAAPVRRRRHRPGTSASAVHRQPLPGRTSTS
jgi:hypothetical protein